MAKTKTKPKEAKVIRKLLLIRKADMKADFLDVTGLKPFLTGEPLNVSPAAWDDELGLSHYGFRLEGFKLKDLEELNKLMDRLPGGTLLSVGETDGEVDDHDTVLATCGLRINELG